jgi:hypothetical protein
MVNGLNSPICCPVILRSSDHVESAVLNAAGALNAGALHESTAEVAGAAAALLGRRPLSRVEYLLDDRRAAKTVRGGLFARLDSDRLSISFWQEMEIENLLKRSLVRGARL